MKCAMKLATTSGTHAARDSMNDAAPPVKKRTPRTLLKMTRSLRRRPATRARAENSGTVIVIQKTNSSGCCGRAIKAVPPSGRMQAKGDRSDALAAKRTTHAARTMAADRIGEPLIDGLLAQIIQTSRRLPPASPAATAAAVWKGKRSCLGASNKKHAARPTWLSHRYGSAMCHEKHSLNLQNRLYRAEGSVEYRLLSESQSRGCQTH